MAEREQRPTDLSETISGVHADISFVNPTDLDSYLDTVNGHVSLYLDSAASLRSPINEARLEYHREDYDDINIMANVSFDADAVTDNSRLSWQTVVSRIMLDRLKKTDAPVYALSHHEHDFYVALNNAYAAFVQFDVETHRCTISLSLEKLHELEYALKKDLSREVDHLDDATHYETLVAFSKMWSIVIDATVDCYGDASPDDDSRPRIIIAPPIDGDYDTFDTTPRHKREGEIPGVTIPEAEAATSANEGFALIGGLRNAVERLQDIAATFRDPEGAEMYGVAGRHFILHGPAGTGKTSLIKAFAHEIEAQIRFVNSTDLVDMWVGNSGKNIRNLINAMKTVEGPVVVFFDEFDTLASKGTGGTSERVDIKKYLNTAIDELSEYYPNIIIAAATNADIDDLEPALVRSGRLEPIGAPAPNEAERVDVWAAILHQSWLDFNRQHDLVFDAHGAEYIQTFTPYEDDLNPVELASLTDGMTGADFKVILERARLTCYRHYRTTGEQIKVSQRHLIQEIRQFGR